MDVPRGKAADLLEELLILGFWRCKRSERQCQSGRYHAQSERLGAAKPSSRLTVFAACVSYAWRKRISRKPQAACF